jgi:hypothetical protein
MGMVRNCRCGSTARTRRIRRYMRGVEDASKPSTRRLNEINPLSVAMKLPRGSDWSYTAGYRTLDGVPAEVSIHCVLGMPGNRCGQHWTAPPRTWGRTSCLYRRGWGWGVESLTPKGKDEIGVGIGLLDPISLRRVHDDIALHTAWTWEPPAQHARHPREIRLRSLSVVICRLLLLSRVSVFALKGFHHSRAALRVLNKL